MDADYRSFKCEVSSMSPKLLISDMQSTLALLLDHTLDCFVGGLRWRQIGKWLYWFSQQVSGKVWFNIVFQDSDVC